eukprot:TRINITY_DN80070_c0_g1_i1.p1 TRINITY_DN80070_c0_g1~~TRINITY_DN80070_c0_g1_i1.p1  ORF type:complete len:521 (+),score=88.73 TRINITY_DN80070_c0_g1_i1:92-1654(+)
MTKSDKSDKPRVHLAVVKCQCFEHLEGEQLFTAVSAGFGRFECDRLLKPSGIELMNLPRAANIEVSVLRRRPQAEGDRQKQLLYHGVISLSAVCAIAWDSAGQSEQESGSRDDKALVWESWLGLFSSDVSLQSQSPDKLFARCQQMGDSSARFPRLFIRLQYLPPGVAAQRPSSSATVSQKSASIAPGCSSIVGFADFRAPQQPQPQSQPQPGGNLARMVSGEDLNQFQLRQHAFSESGSEHHSNQVSPVISSPPAAAQLLQGGQVTSSFSPPPKQTSPNLHTSQSQMTWASVREEAVVEPVISHKIVENHNTSSEIEELRARYQELEQEVFKLRAAEAARDAVQRDFANQVSPMLSKLGVELGEASRSSMQDVNTAISEALIRSSTAAEAVTLAASKVERPELRPFYKPLKSDAIDCLMAAQVLRLCYSQASEIRRIGPGLYGLGANGPRFKCFIDSGRLLSQEISEENESSSDAPIMELSSYLSGEKPQQGLYSSPIQFKSPARLPSPVSIYRGSSVN